MKSSLKEHSQNQTGEVKVEMPLALVVSAQPGYDENVILELIKEQSDQFNYQQIVICQQVDRDYSTQFLQTLLKGKTRKQFNLWDGNDEEFTFKDRINKLAKKAKVHLLTLTLPEALRELGLAFRYEQDCQDFPEEFSLSITERKSLYQVLYEDMMDVLASITRIWVYSQNKHCLYQDELPPDKKELKNLFFNHEWYLSDIQCQQQFLKRAKDIVIRQTLRGANNLEIEGFASIYNQYKIPHTHPNFNDLYSFAIHDYLISSDLELIHKVERWIALAASADEKIIELIAMEFKKLNEKTEDIKTRDLFLLAIAFGNHIKNEN